MERAYSTTEPRQPGESRAIYRGFQTTIKTVGTGKRGSRDLNRAEAREAMEQLLSGDVPPVQVGAFLLAMRVKGEAPEELAGFADGLRATAPALQAETERPLVAVVGAYDGLADSPILSIACAVVAAACGAGVVLHCGDALGPKYGTTVADVLGALGGPALPNAQQSEAMLARSGVAIVHTGEVMPGWRELRALRDQVGVRGPVHSAEKLIDYFGAGRFVVGHTHASYRERLLGALQLLEADRAIVVRGIEGSDVMRPARPVAHASTGPLEMPERLGEVLPALPGAASSAALTRRLLDGEEAGVVAYTVALNAALRLYAAGLVDDPRDGLNPAQRAISDGSAAETLNLLVGSL